MRLLISGSWVRAPRWAPYCSKLWKIMTSERHEQSYQHRYFIPDIISLLSSYECSFLHMSPWRNWLARSTVNRKVGGSSPPGDGCFFCPFLVFTNRSSVIAAGNMLYGFRSVVVITCASHAQGPRFEPGRQHRFFWKCASKN